MRTKNLLFIVIVLFCFLPFSFADEHQQVVLLNKGNVSEIAYSPDGQYLAVAGGIGIWLYPTKTDEPSDLIEYPQSITNISFSSDGQTLAGGDFYGKVHVWDVRTGKRQQTLDLQRRPVDMSLSPDGQFLVAGSANGLIHAWDINKNEVHYTLDAHPDDNVTTVLFSPDGKMFASGGSDNLVEGCA